MPKGARKPAALGLKQFRADGCLSYALFDPASREACLIDPTGELLDDYKTYVADLGLKPALVIDTHTHADHLSASHLLAAQYGCGIAMGEATRSLRATRKVKHGDKLRIGEIQLEVLATPGHTPDGISILAPGLVFTGDTLLIGSTGRTDFPGADAGKQWDSLHKVLGALPPSTVVLPGHDYSGLLFSTIEVEKSRNPHWLIPSREAFVAMKAEELVSSGGASSAIVETIQFNLAANPPSEAMGKFAAATACGTALSGPDRVATIGVDKYVHKLDESAEGTAFIDVREESEYREGHIGLTENIPLSELAFRLSELSRAKRVYFSCLSGRRSLMAAKTLSYLGHPDVVNVSGGFKAWVQSGYPVEK